MIFDVVAINVILSMLPELLSNLEKKGELAARFVLACGALSELKFSSLETYVNACGTCGW
jgi:hypothetical protein